MSHPKATLVGASALAAGCLIFVNRAESRDESEMPQLPGFEPIIGHFNWVHNHWDTLFDDLRIEIVNYTKNKNNGVPVPFLATMAPNRCIIWVVDPVFAELTFRDEFNNVIKGPRQVEPIKPILGDGIFTSNGKVWKVKYHSYFILFTVTYTKPRPGRKKFDLFELLDRSFCTKLK